VQGHAADAQPEQGSWRGLIGPHAGWAFSGDAAGRTYPWLAASHSEAELVVMFGSHRGPRGPNTVFRQQGWDTPLGPLETPESLADRVAEDLGLGEEPAAPAHPDNAVELHLPFVRFFFPHAEMLMLAVAAGESALEIGARVGALVKDRDAVFVGSTDLTHYGPNYGFEPVGRGEAAVDWVRTINDRGFIDAVLAGDAAHVVHHGTAHQSACCSGAVAAAMEAVRAYQGETDPRLVDHYLSYDVRPDASFVGYAGLVL
jgi:AmmeMemoRadiSam system protein B